MEEKTNTMEGQFSYVALPSLLPSSFSGDPTRNEQLSAEGMHPPLVLESDLAKRSQGISTFPPWIHHRFNMRDLHCWRISSRPQSATGEPRSQESDQVWG